MTDQRWSCSAGPRQTKKANDALRAFRWKAMGREELSGIVGQPETEQRCTLTPMFGDPCPEYAEALEEVGKRFQWIISRDNCREVIAAVGEATRKLDIPVDDIRKTPEEIGQENESRETARVEREAQAETHANECDEIVKRLRAEYPWAKPQDDKLSRQARAAANIRGELKRAFPGIKFRVRSDSFSMGDSVDISWSMGPTDKEVQAITGKYQCGHFNGMEDIYENDYSAYSNAVSVVLGQSKYVQTQRDACSEADREKIGRAMCERQGVEYAGRDTRHLFGNGDTEWLSTHIHQALSYASFPAGSVITGIRDQADDDPETHRSPYRIAFDAPIQDEAAGPAECSDCAAEIQKHHHNKHGFDFWLVVPVDRIERLRFERLRDECKSDGGWYSRKWGQCPGGFAFKDEADAARFVEVHFAA